MVKKIKYVLFLIVAFIFCLTINAQARITTTDPTCNAGDTVSIVISSQESVASGKISVSEEGGLAFVSASADGGVANGSIVAFALTENKTSGLATFKFATPSGIEGTKTYKVVFAAEDMSDADGATINDSSATATVTVKGKAETPKQDENTGKTTQNTTDEPKTDTKPATQEDTKSGEYHLSSLSTSVGTLKPSFSTYNQDYTLEFPEDYDISELKSIDVSAKATHSKAKVSGTGAFEVKEGENEIIVRCTAENGKVLAYRIKFTKVVKAQQSDLRLKTFSITRLRSEDKKEVLAKLNEEFKPDVFEYTMDVDEDTDELVLDYEIDEKFKEKITVEVTGNKDLKPGENIITITLTSKDDEKITTTYTIKVTKAGLIEEEEEVEEKAGGSINIKLVIIIAAVIVGLLLLALIILLIINHFQKKKAKAAARLDGDDFGSSDKGLDDDNFDGGDRGFDADIGHDIPPVGVVGPTLTDDSSESNYDYLSREDEISEDIDEDEEEKRFGTGRYNTLRQNYNPDEDYAGFDDTDLPEGTVSEHMINAKLNGEAAELKKRYEIDELQEEIADELKDKKTKRKGRGRRYK